MQRNLRRYVWRARRFIQYRILHVDDTPHRIALSVAIGFFVTWTPTIGLQMALTVLLCAAFRANKLAGVPVAWLTNPLTVAPIYYTNYVVGTWLVPGSEARSWSDWQRLARRVFGFEQGIIDRLQEIYNMAVDVALPLWVGSIIVGTILGGMFYWITYVAVIRARRRLAILRSRRAAKKIAAQKNEFS